MPSNLFTWAIAIALIVLAFEFGAPAHGRARRPSRSASSAATVMVALLLLATNHSPPAQLVAVLFMENALALFESLLPEPWPLPVHVALSAIYLLHRGRRRLADRHASPSDMPPAVERGSRRERCLCDTAPARRRRPRAARGLWAGPALVGAGAGRRG